MLRQEQIDFYHEQGWLGVEDVLSQEDVESLRKVTQEFVEKSRSVTVSDNVFDLEPGHSSAEPRLRRLKDPISLHPLYDRIMHNENIIAINQLSLTLKTLEVGYKGRVSKDNSDQYMLTLDDLYERCWTWSDEFMPSARDEYEWLMAGDIDNSEIPQKRATSLAYSATVIRLLAGCYYEWTKDGSDWTPLAEFIRSSSLEPRSGKGALLVDAGLVAAGGTTPFARAQLVTSAIDYIVRQAASA